MPLPKTTDVKSIIKALKKEKKPRSHKQIVAIALRMARKGK